VYKNLKLLKVIRLIVRRYKLALIIKKSDAVSDASYDPTKDRLIDGYLKTTINELVNRDDFSEMLKTSSLRKKPEQHDKSYFTWELPDFVWSALLNSRNLETLVKDYIGPKVRLDDMYIKTVVDGYGSASEAWHDDNVGYRLKVFMVFDVENTPSGTILIPKSRPNQYKVNLADELARALKVKKKETRGSEVRVGYSAGDCLIFDTNLAHRGDYSSGEGIRFCLIAEFMDREKSNALRGKAPCGPGQGRTKIKIPTEVKELILNSDLIDKDLVNVADEVIYYG
jgi:hypothetical protein